MAVLPMERIGVCALTRDSKKILELLQRRGVVEVTDAGGEDDVFTKADTSAMCALLNKNAAIAQSAVEALQALVPEKKGGPAFLYGRRALSLAEYAALDNRWDELLRVAQHIGQLQREIAEAKSDLLRIDAAMEALVPWMDLPVSDTFEGTLKTAVFIGSLEGEHTVESILALLAETAPELDRIHIDLIHRSKSQTCLMLIALKEDAVRAEEALRAAGLTRPAAFGRLLPRQEQERLARRRKKAEATIQNAEETIVGYAGRRRELEYLEDNMKMRADRYEVVGRLMLSRHAFVLNGFLPAQDGPALEAELTETFDCAVQRTAAERPGAEVPVKLQNHRAFEPAESVVEGYSLPGPSDIDPTGVMSLFYYIMFGLMFGDAGYGLIMAGICGYCLLRFKNMEPNWSKNVRLFFWCGVATVFWGVIFSSYFGDVVDVVSQTFFGVRKSIPPVWFVVTERPMLMLVFCLGLGIVHLTLGYFMKGVTNVKNGDRIGVLYDAVFPLLLWYPLVAVLIGSDMFYDMAGFRFVLPSEASGACLIVAACAAGGIVLTSGRDSNHWPIRLVKGVYALYSALSGWLGDTLSYSRLLALGLASGVIASVMNQLGTMAGGGAAGWIVFILVFLVGHTINFGINVLGAYVHSNRLEYIEFFGKFYEGGGRKFKPFGIYTKYYKIVEEAQ